MASIEAQCKVIRDLHRSVAYHGRCSAGCLLVAIKVLLRGRRIGRYIPAVLWRVAPSERHFLLDACFST
jgi:hypothetical protein